MVAYIPKKGDIVAMNFNPNAGVEQKGKRPALVISNEYFNKTGLAMVCPITTQEKGFRYEVPIPKGECVKGVVLTNHVAAKDLRQRKARFIGKAPNHVTEKVVLFVTAFLRDAA